MRYRELLLTLIIPVILFAGCYRNSGGQSSGDTGQRSLLEAGRRKSDVDPNENVIEVPVPVIEYPPFLDSTVDTGGLSFELLNEMLEGSGYIAEPKFFPPARCEAEIGTGEYPITLYHLSQLERNPSYRKVVTTVVYYSFFHLKSGDPAQWQKLEELRGQRVAVLKLTDRSPYRLSLIEAGLVINEVDTLYQSFMLLFNDKVDLVLTIEVSAQYHLRLMFPDRYHDVVAYDRKLRVVSSGPWFNLDHPLGEILFSFVEQSRNRMLENGLLLKRHEAIIGYRDYDYEKYMLDLIGAKESLE